MSKKKKALGSLRDQLKDAGLVTAKQVRKAEKGALRSDLRIKKGIDVDEAKNEVEAARLKKLDEDRQKNERLNDLAKEKALSAQVNVAYNFEDQGKIKKIYISEENKRQLNKGYLAIVQAGDKYDLVPEVVAKKIEARSAKTVLFLHDRSNEIIDEDDPYKDYPIPDDLEW